MKEDCKYCTNGYRTYVIEDSLGRKETQKTRCIMCNAVEQGSQFCKYCGGEYTEELPCVCGKESVVALSKMVHWPKGKNFTGYGPDDTETCHGPIQWKEEKGTCIECGQGFGRPYNKEKQCKDS